MRTSLAIMLLLVTASMCSAYVSTNVPLDHWSYDAIDKLIGQGLIDSAMMATRPVSRLEMARHIAEAVEKAQQLDEKNEIILSLIDKLKKEFKDELTTTGIVDGERVENFIKPIEDLYFRYVYGDNKPDLENQRGDVFNKHSNYRTGFASRMSFFDTAAFYFHPEYIDSSFDPDRDIELVEVYGKVALGSLEIEVGKDSLWWGPGYHGSIIMSNNTEPFKMVKISNPHPKQLPWIFESLGPYKAVWFLAELEENRTIPEAKLTGIRFNFKPHPALDIGLSRTIMYNGSGRQSPDLKDYWDMFLGSKENLGGELDNNQLAGFDVSVLIPLDGKIPARSVKLYADLAGEDKAGVLPSRWGRLLGLKLNDILLQGRTDIRVEYANNHISGHPSYFYNHHIYQSGYTYKDRVIGHHMGSDASDFFVRLDHYLTDEIILGLEFDREKSLLSTNRQTIDQLGLDLAFLTSNNWRVKTGYRYESTKNSSRPDNHIIHIQLVYEF